MKEYKLKVCGIERSLPLVSIGKDEAYASFVVIGDTELVTEAAKELITRIGETELIVTVEAKGIALAHEMTKLLELKKFVVARKSIKSYVNHYVCESLESITTVGEQKIYLDENDIALVKGKKVAIVDDVISKGASIAALERLVEKAGGIVVEKVAILAEGDAKYREDITYLEAIPLFRRGENDYEAIN